MSSTLKNVSSKCSVATLAIDVCLESYSILNNTERNAAVHECHAMCHPGLSLSCGWEK